MKRRDLLRYGLYAGAAAAVTPSTIWTALPPASKAHSANDLVPLGNTGIKLSRLAVGTGTSGWGRASNQTRQLGIDGLADLFWYAYDEGVRFWDSADMYGSHPHMKRALPKVKRENIVIMTKSRSTTAAAMKADIERFRKEIGTDYLDLVLLHAVTDEAWPTNQRGAMDVLQEARAQGVVRAHGISCHSIGALQAAAASPWVQVDLARINPIGAHMDADPETVLGLLRRMKGDGKGVIGMKILGQGKMRSRVDEALAYALRQEAVDCFTIGVENRKELADLIQRIPPASTRG
jgi:1-deoxyxylulose-5-phosphate synthase